MNWDAELNKIADVMVELSEQRTTYMKRTNMVTERYIALLKAHGQYIIDISQFIKPEVAREILNDLQEFGEIVQEFGECLTALGENLKAQNELDIALIDSVSNKLDVRE